MVADELEVTRVPRNLSETESLVEPDRALVPGRDEQTETLRLPVVRCIFELGTQERFAELSARQVGPEPDPDFDDVAVPVEVPERFEAVALAEHGAPMSGASPIAHRRLVGGVGREIVEVVRRLVPPARHLVRALLRPPAPALVRVLPRPPLDPHGSDPTFATQRAAASSPRRTAASREPPTRKP